MAGKRIRALTEKITFDPNDFIALDNSVLLEAQKLKLGKLGNTYFQGSVDNINWHNEITAADNFYRFSSDGGTTWTNLVLNVPVYNAGTGLTLSGTTFNHTNSITLQSVSALYPITIDSQGHIASYGSAITALKNPNNLILRFDSGNSEGTSQYTYDGSVAKTLDILAGTNVTINKNAGSVTINASAGPTTLDSLTNVSITNKLTGDLLQWNGTSWVNVSVGSLGVGTGTVSSVAFSAGTTGFSVSGSPITTSGTIGISGTLVATHGGTGHSSYTTGDLLFASSSTALSKLASIATGNVLLSGGIATAPSWGKVGLTSHVTGTLPIANGGTNATTASGARTNLGATTVGSNIFTLTNPNAVSFIQINADNTVSAVSALDFRNSIGAVGSVGLALPTSVFSITNSPVTSSGTLTGSFISQSARTVFAAPATDGTPSFRLLSAEDINSGTFPSGDFTFQGKINATASTTVKAGLNLSVGSAPTSPLNGDLWVTASGIFARVNGVTKQLDLTGGATNPAGTGTELQYRLNSTTFGGLTGSSVSGSNITLGGSLNINASIPLELVSLANGHPTLANGISILSGYTTNSPARTIAAFAAVDGSNYGLAVYTNGKIIMGGIPEATTTNVLYYNASTKEISYGVAGGGGSTSPLTTKGDLYTYSTGNTRLPVGTNGQILSVNSATSTGLQWINPPSGSSIWTDAGTYAHLNGYEEIYMPYGKSISWRTSNTNVTGNNAFKIVSELTTLDFKGGTSDILAFRLTNTNVNGESYASVKGVLGVDLGTNSSYEVDTSFIAGFAVNGYNKVLISGTGLISQITRANGPATPASGWGLWYGKSDGKAYYKNSSGVEYDLTASGAGGGTVTSVSAGVGMSFSTITSSGSVAMGTPSTITTSSSNSVGTGTHNHTLDLSGRSVSTQHSLTGGGNLGSNRTLSLVNDVAAPGNSKYYGTNSIGTRGWFDLPAGGSGMVYPSGSGIPIVVSGTSWGTTRTDVPTGNFVGTTDAQTLSSKVVQTTASTASLAGLRVPHGTAPSSPVNGDLWSTTAGFYSRINGTVQQFLMDIMTTSGDIIYRNSSNVTARLGRGAAGTVLTSDGTNISWQPITGGSIIEDISFDFNDIIAGTTQTYVLDIKASFGYTIESVVLQSDGTLNGVNVKIETTNVTGLSSITVTSSISETNATGARTVITNNKVTINTTNSYSGSPTLLRGKLKIRRT